MKLNRPGRRRFLQDGAALAGLVVAAPTLAEAASSPAGPAPAAAAQALGPTDNNSIDAVLYGRRSRFVTTTRDMEGSGQHAGGVLHADPWRPGATTPLGESVGIVTPTSLHYTTQHNYGIPDINPRDHRLMIHGMVDRPKVFTMDELKRYPYISRIYFLECIGNKQSPRDRTVTQSHGRTACSEWAGVPLSTILKEAGVQSGGTWIVAEAVGGGMFTKSVPMSKAMDDVLLAFGQNGEPVRPDHGYPLRLVVPGYEGIYQVKWLRRIKVVDRPYLHYQEQDRFMSPDKRAKDFMYELGPKSVITFPSGEHHLSSRGSWLITGLAWSGAGAVRRVEVSTNGGQSWADAQLLDPVLKRAHTRFVFPWKWNGEEAVITSRCTDEVGQVQPSVAEFAKFWGLTEQQVHSSPGSRWGHANYTMPWQVNRDGRVQNAMVGTEGVREHG